MDLRKSRKMEDEPDRRAGTASKAVRPRKGMGIETSVFRQNTGGERDGQPWQETSSKRDAVRIRLSFPAKILWKGKSIWETSEKVPLSFRRKRF